MTLRRSLVSNVGDLGDMQREKLREFVTQETVEKQTSSSPKETGTSRPRGMVAITVRLRPEIASGLKRASLERQLSGTKIFTQQDLLEMVLEPWLRSEGFL